MKKITCTLALLTLIQTPAHAEIFKCKLASGKTVYQPMPCPTSTVNQGVVKVEKMDANKIAEAQERLNAWKANQALKEAAEKQAEKERREELARQESVEALKRSALAQEELAEAAKRPIVANPIVQPNWRNFYPYPYQNPGRHHHHEFEHQDRTNPPVVHEPVQNPVKQENMPTPAGHLGHYQ